MGWHITIGDADFDMEKLPAGWWVPVAEDLEEQVNWYGVLTDPIHTDERAKRVVAKVAQENSLEVDLPESPMSGEDATSLIRTFFRYEKGNSRPKAGTKKASRSSAAKTATTS